MQDLIPERISWRETQIDKLRRELDALASEAAEMADVLRKVAETAPHGPFCTTQIDPDALCDCYLPDASRLSCCCSAAVKALMEKEDDA